MARSPISSPFTGLWPHSHHCFLSSLNLSRLQCFFLLVAALPGAPPKIFPRLDAVCHLNLSSNATSSRKLSMTAAAAAKSLQSCPTLCDPIDGSPLGSPVPGILQARTLEWVAISFSNASKWKVKVKSLSHVWLLETPWTAAHQALPSMGFSRQEYWSGVPLPSYDYLIKNHSSLPLHCIVLLYFLPDSHCYNLHG